MPQSEQKRTTVTVHESVHDRLADAKPFDSLSYSEFINELLDQYEPGGGEP
jgi:predicted CopG family antitoxin